jgi:hypothetical protein
METKGRTVREKMRRGLLMASLADLPVVGTDWLWPGRIALGSVTLLVGYPDVGKSHVALDIAARVSRGGAWPDGRPSAGAGGVMLLSAEDDLVRKVRPTLEGAGADFSRLSFPYLAREENGAEATDEPINFKRDLKLVAAALQAAPGTKLVIVDPFNAYMGSGAGTRGADTMSVLRELYELAARFHVAVLVVTPLRQGGGEAIYRTVGGLGLTSMARAIWMVTRAKSEGGGRKSEVRGQGPEVGVGREGSGGALQGERRLLLPVKNNLAGERGGMAFRLTMGARDIVPQVEWSAGAVNMTADEALRELRRKPVADSLALGAAMTFLEEALAEGPRLVKEVEMEAKGRGISYASLLRARIELEIHAFRKKVPGPWWMCLAADRKSRSSDLRETARENHPTAVTPEGENDRTGENFSACSARCKNPARVECLAKNAGNFADFQEKRAARVECLAENTGDFDEIREKVVRVDECLAKNGMSLEMSEEEAGLQTLVAKLEQEMERSRGRMTTSEVGMMSQWRRWNDEG